MQTLSSDTQFRAVSIEETADGGSTFSVINAILQGQVAGRVIVHHAG